MFEHIATVIELIFLGIIVWQGEKIRFYEHQVHRIQSEREDERKLWRDQKRKQATKKSALVADVVDQNLETSSVVGEGSK